MFIVQVFTPVMGWVNAQTSSFNTLQSAVGRMNFVSKRDSRYNMKYRIKLITSHV